MRYLTYEQVVELFEEQVLPAVQARYGVNDQPAIDQAWNDFVDMLRKDRQVSAEAYDEWTYDG